jgi:hypothetical protein
VDNLLFVPEIMERYQVSAPTARKIIRQCIHIEKPKMGVYESALSAYERNMMVEPGKKKATKRLPSRWETPPKDSNGNYFIPKRRA